MVAGQPTAITRFLVYTASLKMWVELHSRFEASSTKPGPGSDRGVLFAGHQKV
jgi:hypothetical protein